MSRSFEIFAKESRRPANGRRLIRVIPSYGAAPMPTTIEGLVAESRDLAEHARRGIAESADLRAARPEIEAAIGREKTVRYDFFRRLGFGPKPWPQIRIVREYPERT